MNRAVRRAGRAEEPATLRPDGGSLRRWIAVAELVTAAPGRLPEMKRIFVEPDGSYHAGLDPMAHPIGEGEQGGA